MRTRSASPEPIANFDVNIAVIVVVVLLQIGTAVQHITGHDAKYGVEHALRKR